MMQIRQVLAAMLTLAFFTVSACGGASDAKVERPSQAPAATAAMVNGEPVYITDVELEAVAQGLIAPADGLDPRSETYDLVLNQLIDQRLMAQEAIRRELDNDLAAQRRLLTARERILGNLLLENIVAAQVNETAIQDMYAKQVKLQQLDDEVRIRHILSDSREDAVAVLKRLKNGADFSTVAFEMSTTTSPDCAFW